MSLSKVLEIALGELGVTESPAGSNRVKYWTDFDPAFQGQPWCCAFLWWCFDEAGESMAFFGGGKTASCSMLLRWYKEQGLVYSVAEVKVGDIVILNFHGTKDTEHCGLVTCVYDSDDGIRFVDTIEGNTSSSNGSQSNGGAVCAKTRYPSQIVGVCRPTYKPDDPQPVDDVTGHWAEKSIRKVINSEIMAGYPDGSFKPDSPVTRAELVTVLDRLGLVD